MLATVFLGSAGGWRAIVFALVILCAPIGTPTTSQAQSAEAVSTLLADLRNALSTGQLQPFFDASAPRLAQADRARLEQLLRLAPVATVAVGERDRPGPQTVVADILVSRASTARLSSWLFDLAPGNASGRLEIISAAELASYDDLMRHTLDAARAFRVKGLQLNAADFEMTMAEGDAFVNVGDHVGIIILLGRARVRFTPPSAGEQGQVRILTGAPDLDAPTTAMAIRAPTDRFREWVTRGVLVPSPVDRTTLTRAREVFDARSSQRALLALGHLTPEPWTVAPPQDGVSVDFRTERYGWLTYSQDLEAVEDVSLVDRDKRKQISVYDSRAGAENGFRVEWTEASRLRHVELDLQFEPERMWLSGRASLSIDRTRFTSSMVLAMARSLVVSSVELRGVGPLLAVRLEGQDAIVVSLPPRASALPSIVLDVSYQGRLDPQPVDRENLAQTFRSAPRGLDEVSTLEQRYLYSGLVPWYPKLASEHHATAAIRITVPEPYQAFASGAFARSVASTLAGRAADDSRARTFEYRAAQPVRYLAMIVGRFRQVGSSAMSGETTVQLHAAGPRPTRVSAERAAAIANLFAEVVGPRPYPSLVVAAMDSETPSGHSPAHLALLGIVRPGTDVSWRADPAAFDDVPDFFLAHEIAHQWWGQAVGPATYHDRWVSEGFAQYFAWLYVERHGSPGDAAHVMNRMRETAFDYAAEGPISLGPRLGHLRGQARVFRALVYNKAAVVLHMLRRLMGDEVFFAGVRRLYASRKFMTASDRDVVAAFAPGAPIDVDRFFRRWIHEPGYARVAVRWQQPRPDQIDIEVTQTTGPFDIPLDVRIVGVDGSRAIIPLRVTQPREVFAIPVNARVRRVEPLPAGSLVEVID